MGADRRRAEGDLDLFGLAGADGGGADALAECHLHHQVGIADDAAGGDRIARKAHVAVNRSTQLCRALIRLGQLDDLVEDRLGVLFRVNAHRNVSCPQPRLRAVLMTLMPLKRAVLDPCDTADDWLGWPLPSKNDPPSR